MSVTGLLACVVAAGCGGASGTAADAGGDAKLVWLTDSGADVVSGDLGVDPGPAPVDLGVDLFTEPADLGPQDLGAPDLGPADLGPADPGPAPDLPPPPDVTVSTSLCSPAGGSKNIYDLQNPDCPDHPNPVPLSPEGIDVDLQGVVVTAVFADTVFIQEESGGPYSGVAIFAHGQSTAALKVGDELQVKGSFGEFFELSQIYLTSWKVTGKATVPAPYVVAHPEWIANDGPLAELLEGVLVRVEGVETIHTKPDCPHDFGEFLVTGGLRIDDKGYTWAARLGDKLASVTGPLNYTFGNFKIEPRTEADVVATKKGLADSVSKCIKGDCIVQAETPGTKKLLVSEVMVDPFQGDSLREWIELYNPGTEPVSVAGFSIRDCFEQKAVLSGEGSVIPPKGFLVIGQSTNTSENGGTPVDLAYGPGFYLANTIGAVLLFDAAGKLVDQTRYSAFDPWTVLKPGHSLERKSATPADGTVPEAWQTAKGKYGPSDDQGSPGKANGGW